MINKVNFCVDDDYFYHGSYTIVREPKIIIKNNTKDFGFGFYITKYKEQAVKWAKRFNKFNKIGIVNKYKMNYDLDNLNVKIFKDLTDEWLDFIVNCRNGKAHNYDIVEGPMADDKIYNYIEDYIQGNINREAFFALAKFNKPTHQICLCTDKALNKIKFLEYEEVL